ncbi:MAG: ADOP family duplicated permease [Longimicrobiales bacterium]
MKRASWVTVAYRGLIALLPARVREADSEEIVATFEEQWAAAGKEGRRGAVWLRAFGRIPWVLLAEWRDEWRQRGRKRSNDGLRGGRMDSWWRTTRQGVRSLSRSPTFALSVVLLLGLGVGSVSAIFAVVDHVLLRALPYPAAERLIVVENGSHSGPAYREFEGMGSVEEWSAVKTELANLTGEGEPLRIVEASITTGFFAMFGARRVAGRLLNEADHRRGESVVLSHGAWQRIWGGDASVIGRTIRLDDEAVVVVGVLDPGFLAPEALMNPATDVWRPLNWVKASLGRRDQFVLSVAGRVAEGATLADVRAEAERLAESRARAFPDIYVTRDGTVSDLPMVPLQEATVGRVRRGLGLLFGAVTLLLLVACANVTHLFLARATERMREMSVRRALGAGNRALVSQLLVESLLLGLAGALLGVLLAEAGLRAFFLLNPGGLPRLTEIRMDVRVTAFAAAIAVFTSVVFGMLPALRIAAADPGRVLRSAGRNATGTRGMHAVRNGIVILEVALSLVLMTQAGWLFKSFIRLHDEPLGFRTTGVYTIPLTMSGVESVQQWHTRMEAVRQSIASVPDVQTATFGLTMPLEFTGGRHCCWRTRLSEPASGGEWAIAMHPVDADYFEAMDIRPIAGALWSRLDATADPVPIVISEPFAVEAFGNRAAAIGRTVRSGEASYLIAGVVPDNRHYGPDQEHGVAAYVPATSLPLPLARSHLAVYAPDARPGLAGRLRDAIWRIEPDLPVPAIRSMAEWSSLETAQSRFESALSTIFGAVALLLVAAGLAGTLFYAIGLERRDMGIRLALGATSAGLERRVLGRGVGMAAFGAFLGGTGAWLAGRLLESRLFGVDARDPGTLALAITFLLGVATIASWIPARRAAATSPMESLRAD